MSCDLNMAKVLLRALQLHARVLGSSKLESYRRIKAFIDDLTGAVNDAERQAALASVPEKVAGEFVSGSGV